MAFGDRLRKWGDKSFGDKMKSIVRVVDPVLGRVVGADKKDKDKLKPQAQHYGGSAEKTDWYRGRFTSKADKGEAAAYAGVDRSNAAADRADANLRERAGNANTMFYKSLYGSDADRAKVGQSMSDYGQARKSIMGSASAMERDAATMDSRYQQTAEKQFALNQDRNQRAALSLGAGRGAAGLRTALSSSSNANADAAAQAEVTRAQEFNQLQQMKADQRQAAAALRTNVAAQDQAAAGMYSGRQLAQDANAQAANAQAAGIDVNRAGVQQNAATLQTNVGTAMSGQNTQATLALEHDQLSANQKNEDQRQVQARNDYNDRWMVLSKFNMK